jgi:hypothetical protein
MLKDVYDKLDIFFICKIKSPSFKSIKNTLSFLI